jgi:hypothetical protein
MNFERFLLLCCEMLSLWCSTCNYKKTDITFETWLTIYISLSSEGKTQIRWDATIEQKIKKYVKVNNVLPKESPIMY